MVLLLLLLSTGCLVPPHVVGACEDVGLEASGTVSFDDAALPGSADELNVETNADGACVTAVTGEIDFGQGCSLYVQADGNDARLAIFQVDLHGEEGCGLEGAGWTVSEYRDSAVLVDGGLEPTDSEHTWCHTGTLTVDLDLVVADLAGASADVVGTITLSGVSYADVEGGTCD